MGAQVEVASLFARLGLNVDKGAWGKGNKAIDGMKSALGGLALYFGGKFLGKSLLGFNSTVEDTKNQIAGMLALSKKTNLSDEAANAEMLYANLQKRAASLPGTTAEYAQMLGMLTQPVTAAGLGLQELEDLTVNAVVAAKGLGVNWEVAARDIDQALRGQFKSVDQLTGKLLSSMGYAGEAGRAKFNALSAKQRASVVKAALTQKQIAQLAEAQGKTFSGRLSTLQDAAQQFLGKVGKALFGALGSTIDRVTTWIAENQQAIEDVANTIGTVLAAAFAAVSEAIGFFIEHSDLAKAILIALAIVATAFGVAAAAAWIAATWPLLLLIAGLAAIVYAVMDVINVFRGGQSKIAKALGKWVDWIKTCAKAIGTALAAPFIGMWRVAVYFFDKIKALPGRIVDAFRMIGERIKDFFVDAFDWIVDEAKKLPSRIGGAAKDFFVNDVLGWIPSMEQIRGGGSAGPEAPITRPNQSSIGNTNNKFDVKFNINGAGDPGATGASVRKHLDEWWSNQLGNAEDAT